MTGNNHDMTRMGICIPRASERSMQNGICLTGINIVCWPLYESIPLSRVEGCLVCADHVDGRYGIGMYVHWNFVPFMLCSNNWV